MKLLYSTAALLCALHSANGQQPGYQPFDKNPTAAKQLLDAVDERYRKDIASLSGPYKKETIALYRERTDVVKQLITSNELVTDTTAVSYITALTHRILASNPHLNNNGIRVYFSRSGVPNASSLGEGTIVFNAGLFYRLSNEAQMAFVICHELAHYFLNHGNKAITRYIETVNSDEFQQQLKSIQRSEFERNRQVEKLAQTVNFKNRRHSRYLEQTADSMALALLKNTGYDVKEVISCMALLDSIDKPDPIAKVSVQKQFDFDAYPFKTKWITGNSLVFTNGEDEKEERNKTADSLKTHPDCSKRIARLQSPVNTHHSPGSKTFLVSEMLFKTLQQHFLGETLEYYFETGSISQCLFSTLQRLSTNPGNAYLLGMAGRCLNKLHTAQKEHTLGKITDLPNPDHDEDYNSLLKLLQNLRLMELSAIQYHFLQHHQDAGRTNEDFVAALIYSKEAFGKPEEKQEWIRYYQSQFPKPKYNLPSL